MTLPAWLRRCAPATLLFCALLSIAASATAQPGEQPAAATVFAHPSDTWLSVTGQINVITQSHASFRSPYSGDNSLSAARETATSRVLTLSATVRATKRTDVSVDIESAGGRGLGDALGLAGFTNLDVVRNPTLGSKPYLARLLVRQRIGGSLEITAGKLSTADSFDRNGVGSDSHLQFMNWTVDNNGAYDYAADTRGYTWGAVAQYHAASWTARFGEMLMPKVANGLSLDWDIGRARAENVELELRPALGPRPTTIRVLSFLNHANMGDYRIAVQTERDTSNRPVIEATREQGRRKFGFGINLEQALTADARAFGRWGMNEPHFESFAYTEVNSSVAAGADCAGRSWHRPLDKVGVAFVTNGISLDHQRYLALGGDGFLLGDGALTYGREQILESYYTAHVWRGVFASGDVQHIAHPGYNVDRGPVTVFGARLHVDF